MTANKKKGAPKRRPARSSQAILRTLKRTAEDEERRAREELLANLRAAMAYTNVSSSELARRLSVGRDVVSKMLAGKQGFSFERLAAVAHALGMSLHVWLRTPAASKPRPVSPDQHEADVVERGGRG